MGRDDLQRTNLTFQAGLSCWFWIGTVEFHFFGGKFLNPFCEMGEFQVWGKMGAEKQRTRGRCRVVVSDQETYKMHQNATGGHFPETPKAN